MYAYLDHRVTDLDAEDMFLLSAMRRFVAVRGKDCVCAALAPGFAKRGASAALPDFVTIMTLIGRHARTPLSFAPPVWPKLTDDEARILTLFALDRRHDHGGLDRAVSTIVGEAAASPMLVAIDTVSTWLAGARA